MQKQCYVYLDNELPLNVDHSLVFQTPNRVFFVNLDDGSIIIKNGIVHQINNNKYFVIRDTNNLYGVIRYDGAVIVPFEFYKILIWNNIIKVQKDKNSDYEQYCTIPK